jgi:hypothetical protein
MTSTTTATARYFSNYNNNNSNNKKSIQQILYGTKDDGRQHDPWSLAELQQRTVALIESNNNNNNPHQHKVCFGIAGGGGTALSTLAATSGASQLLLEGTITYDRSSYQTFIRKNSSSLSSLDDDDNNNNNKKKKFSYTSMEAAKLASMSALWRGMELQSLNHQEKNSSSSSSTSSSLSSLLLFANGGQVLTRVIGVGAASTLQTTTAGAKSRTGRPSFGNIVATRGDGRQICMSFTLNHHHHHHQKEQQEEEDGTSTSSSTTTTANSSRFEQDIIVSHLILRSLEHFLTGTASTETTQTDSTNAIVDPREFPGVTIEEWSNNVLTVMTNKQLWTTRSRWQLVASFRGTSQRHCCFPNPSTMTRWMTNPKIHSCNLLCIPYYPKTV